MVITVAAVVAYWKSFPGEFVMDDDMLLTKNSIVKAHDGLYRFWFTTEPADYWPVANSTLWFEWRLWGENPLGYRLMNLALHITAALLAWAVLAKLSIPGAFLGALLFTVHPVNVESVAWIAQRKGLMAMVFFLTSVLCFIIADTPRDAKSGAGESKAKARSSAWFCLSLASFILAALSKGSILVLPGVLLLIQWWRGRLTRCEVLRLAPFFILAVGFAAVNIWFQKHGADVYIRDVSLVQRVTGAGAIIWFYLSKALVPIDLLFVYPGWQIDPAAVGWWWPLAAALIVTALVWRHRTAPWGRTAVFAWGFFCLALVPVLGFTDVGFMRYSLVADHYQSIAVLAVVTAIAAALHAVSGGAAGTTHWAARIASVLLVVALGTLTSIQSRSYADANELYEHTLQKNPRCWLILNQLGMEALGANRPAAAATYFDRALALEPAYAFAENNLGVAKSKSGETASAIDHYRRALQIRKDFWEAHYNLGDALFQADNVAAAIAEYREANRLRPRNAEILDHLGRTLNAAGDWQEAIPCFEEALRIRPDLLSALINCGTTLLSAGRPQEALSYFEEAVRRQPADADAQNNLGTLLTELGRPKDAVGHLERAVRLQPTAADAYYNLANALAADHRMQEAISRYAEAIRLKPDFPEAHNNLSQALLAANQGEEALAHAKESVRLSPQSPDAYVTLALVLDKLNRPEEAIAAASSGLALARMQGNAAKARQIEEWISNSPNKTSR